MPVISSLALIIAFILPAFLLYEPPETGETISLKLAAVICIAVFGFVAAFFRVFASWWRTRRLLTDWRSNSTPIELASVSLPVFKLRHVFPVFAVVGIRKPKIFIAEQLLDPLEPDEIAAVVRHEFGHIAAWDNLKRLAMKMSGDIMVVPIGRVLDHNWSESSEKAADDFAVKIGGRSTALNLASALIKIARLVPDKPLPPMPATSYALGTDNSLTLRVKRLLSLADQQESKTTGQNNVFILGLLFAIGSIAAFATDSSLLQIVHEVSETVLAALR